MKNKSKLIKPTAGTWAVILCTLLSVLSGCEKKGAGEGELLLLPIGDAIGDAIGGTIGDAKEEVWQDGWAAAEEAGSASAGSPSEQPAADGDGMAAGQAGESMQATAGNGGLAECIVHICGAVKEPGVYSLDAGSRIYQAIEEAGGLSEEADGDYLNQADLIADGMKIYVPTKAEAEEMGTGSGWANAGEAGSGGKDTPLININTAGEELLCTLPGIGSSKAKSIIAYREKNGAFQKTEDIMNVEGIKDGLYRKIKDSITV